LAEEWEDAAAKAMRGEAGETKAYTRIDTDIDQAEVNSTLVGTIGI
jgi:hypothetical protein